MTKMIPIVPPVLTAALFAISPSVAEAQARSTRDTTTAYGARLTAPDATTTVNQNRVNNRINNRLSLRVERYRLDSTNNPTAAFRSSQDDEARTPTIASPMPTEDAGNDNSKLRP